MYILSRELSLGDEMSVKNYKGFNTIDVERYFFIVKFQKNFLSFERFFLRW